MMESLDKFLDERMLDCETFMARHKHPFLLIESATPPDQKRFTVATQVASMNPEVLRRLQELNQLEERGWRLHHKLVDYALVAITKKEINPFKEHISLGRTTLSDIVIPDSRISKRHACFTYHEDKGCFALSDLGSTNGTTINSCALEPRKEYELSYGDTISFGQFTTRFLNSCQVWNILQTALVKLPENGETTHGGN